MRPSSSQSSSRKSAGYSSPRLPARPSTTMPLQSFIEQQQRARARSPWGGSAATNELRQQNFPPSPAPSEKPFGHLFDATSTSLDLSDKISEGSVAGGGGGVGPSIGGGGGNGGGAPMVVDEARRINLERFKIPVPSAFSGAFENNQMQTQKEEALQQDTNYQQDPDDAFYDDEGEGEYVEDDDEKYDEYVEGEDSLAEYDYQEDGEYTEHDVEIKEEEAYDDEQLYEVGYHSVGVNQQGHDSYDGSDPSIMSEAGRHHQQQNTVPSRPRFGPQTQQNFQQLQGQQQQQYQNQKHQQQFSRENQNQDEYQDEQEQHQHQRQHQQKGKQKERAWTEPNRFTTISAPQARPAHTLAGTKSFPTIPSMVPRPQPPPPRTVDHPLRRINAEPLPPRYVDFADSDRTIRPTEEPIPVPVHHPPRQKSQPSPFQRSPTIIPLHPDRALMNTPLFSDDELRSIPNYSALLAALNDKYTSTRYPPPENMEAELKKFLEYDYASSPPNPARPAKFIAEIDDESYDKAGEIIENKRKAVRDARRELGMKRRKVKEVSVEEMRPEADRTTKKLQRMRHNRKELAEEMCKLLMKGGLKGQSPALK